MMFCVLFCNYQNMVKKALSQVSVNHSNGHLVKLYATELNLFYGKYSFALHNLWLFLILVEISLFCTK